MTTTSWPSAKRVWPVRKRPSNLVEFIGQSLSLSRTVLLGPLGKQDQCPDQRSVDTATRVRGHACPPMSTDADTDITNFETVDMDAKTDITKFWIADTDADTDMTFKNSRTRTWRGQTADTHVHQSLVHIICAEVTFELWSFLRALMTLNQESIQIQRW